uniref:Complex I assembly factor TIMMDC1, mitochondrial n=1 Tax=Megafenestra aurita TaxID=2291010 RepID=A0A4Y7NIJ5_9CRUS|nr:EOG090X0FS6 [Megafenestra aurita]
MWRRKILAQWGLTIFGVEIITNNDVIDPKSKTAQKLAEQAALAIEKETGWDRVMSIFELDEFRSISPELDNCLTAGSVGLIFGMFLGGVTGSKREYEDFITRNKASQFESHFDAKSKLQFNVTKAMAVSGWRIAWRLGLFSGAYTFFTTVVSTYRNKSSIFEYSAGGLLAGAMYKSTMGPKAMVSGGLAGGVLGAMAGAVSVGAMMLTGTTTEELRYWKKGWKDASNREILSVNNRARVDAMGPLSLAHDLNLIKEGKQDIFFTGDVLTNEIKESNEEKEESISSEILDKSKR